MHCTQNFRCLLVRLLLAWLLAVATMVGAQETDPGKAEEEPDSGEEPRFHMGIIHQGPGTDGQGLASLFPDQVRELEHDGSAFNGVLLPQETPQQQGAALIIPDEGRSPAHGIAAGLRRALPDYGWSTLAISLPESDPESVPERVFGTRSEMANQDKKDGTGKDGAKQTGDAESAKPAQGQGKDRAGEKTEEPSMTIEVSQGTQESAAEARQSWRKSAMGRVEAAVAFLRSSGNRNIALIGRGAGADLALRYADANAAQFPAGGLGMIWLDGRFRAPYNKPLDEVLGDGYGVPILDLYQRGRNDKAARSRNTAARRGEFKAYTQSAIPIPSHDRETAKRRLGSWVGGWLKETMAGMEIN